ncbi:MAG: hypothetical protein ACE5EM_07490 [Sphingomonadales bacterium]
MKYAALAIFIVATISGCSGGPLFPPEVAAIEFEIRPASSLETAEQRRCEEEMVRSDYRYAFSMTGRVRQTGREDYPGWSQYSRMQYAGYKNLLALKHSSDGKSAIALFSRSNNPMLSGDKTKPRCSPEPAE